MRPLVLDGLGKAVEEAGFELLDVGVDLKGHLQGASGASGSRALVVAGTGQRFLLKAGAGPDGQATWVQLGGWGSDQELLVHGQAFGLAHGEIEVEVESAQVLE